jgi:hypothetical protein
LARIGSALVDVGLTEGTGKSTDASTRKLTDSVDARSGVLTGVRITFVDIVGTHRAAPTGSTNTGVRSQAVHTAATVFARVGCAFVDGCLTERAFRQRE